MTAPVTRQGVVSPSGVLPWLDERSEAELLPPCEARRYNGGPIAITEAAWVKSCESPAAYAVRTRCGACGLTRWPRLMCADHLSPSRITRCQGCLVQGRVLLVHAEPLRPTT